MQSCLIRDVAQPFYKRYHTDLNAFSAGESTVRTGEIPSLRFQDVEEVTLLNAFQGSVENFIR